MRILVYKEGTETVLSKTYAGTMVFAELRKDIENAVNNYLTKNPQTEISDINIDLILNPRNACSKIVVDHIDKAILGQGLFQSAFSKLGLSKWDKKIRPRIRIFVAEDAKQQERDERVNFTYTAEKMKQLERLNDIALAASGDELLFSEIENESWVNNNGDDLLSYSQILRANSEIDKIVYTIKNKQLTPYEAVLYIHEWLAKNFKYNPTSRMEYTQTIAGAFERPAQIVCAGYASLFKAVVDRVDLDGLKCRFVNYVALDKNGNTDLAHIMVALDIDDSYYKIKGEYLDDPTNDSEVYNGSPDNKKTEKEGAVRGFACCCFTAECQENMKENYIETIPPNRYHQIISDRSISSNAQLVDRAYGAISDPKKLHEFRQEMAQRSKYQRVAYSVNIDGLTFMQALANMLIRTKSKLQIDELYDMVVNRVQRSQSNAYQLFKDDYNIFGRWNSRQMQDELYDFKKWLYQLEVQ